MIDLETYNRIKAKVDELQRQADKASGALEQMRARLKKEFGCESIKEAKRQLSEWDKTIAAEEAKLQKLLAAFEKQWGDKLQVQED